MPTYPSLELGSAGPTVTALQLALTARGCNVEASGDFDDATAEQVRAFQSAAGLEENGMADDATWAALGDVGQEAGGVELSPTEYPSLARAVYFGEDSDGYLSDLGIDPTGLQDDEPPNV
jgi:peptidoglycan hydrolase-like protein with peptidoglycan-binding domain